MVLGVSRGPELATLALRQPSWAHLSDRSLIGSLTFRRKKSSALSDVSWETAKERRLLNVRAKSPLFRLLQCMEISWNMYITLQMTSLKATPANSVYSRRGEVLSLTSLIVLTLTTYLC